MTTSSTSTTSSASSSSSHSTSHRTVHTRWRCTVIIASILVSMVTRSLALDPAPGPTLLTLSDVKVGGAVTSLVVSHDEPLSITCRYHDYRRNHGNGEMVELFKEKVVTDGGNVTYERVVGSATVTDDVWCGVTFNISSKDYNSYLCRLANLTDSKHTTTEQPGLAVIASLEVSVVLINRPSLALDLIHNISSLDQISQREISLKISEYQCAQQTANDKSADKPSANSKSSDTSTTNDKSPNKPPFADKTLCPEEQKTEEEINLEEDLKKLSSSTLSVVISSTQKPVTSSKSADKDGGSTNVEKASTTTTTVATTTKTTTIATSSKKPEDSKSSTTPGSVEGSQVVDNKTKITTMLSTTTTKTTTTLSSNSSKSSKLTSTSISPSIKADEGHSPPSTPLALPMMRDTGLGAGLALVIILAVMAAGACAAGILYRRRKKGKKSNYITFGNPSYGKDNLPANDYGLDSPLTLTSNGYTVLA